MKGLYIQEPYATLIAVGTKTIELRNLNINPIEKVHIISSGTNNIIGTVDIIDSEDLTQKDISQLIYKHFAPLSTYKKAWKLDQANYFDHLLSFQQKKGQVIWAKFDSYEFSDNFNIHNKFLKNITLKNEENNNQINYLIRSKEYLTIYFDKSHSNNKYIKKFNIKEGIIVIPIKKDNSQFSPRLESLIIKTEKPKLSFNFFHRNMI